MDIITLTNEITQKVINENLPVIVEKQISKTIEEIVSETFRSYSDFGKTVKEKVNSSLKVSLDGLNLPDMTGLILDKVKEISLKAINESDMKDLEDSIRASIGEMPEEIKLSELVQRFGFDCHQQLSEWWNEQYKTISFYCEENKEFGWWAISLDEAEDVPVHKCAYKFYISHKGDMFILEMNNVRSKLNQMITRSDFDLLLLRLYHSHKTKVIIDLNYVETEFNFEE